MHYQVSLFFLIGIAALSAAQTASNGCPDDTYTYKETNSGPNKVRRCYKLYEAADITDQCKVIDYCRPLHPKAIPATINSIEERDFLKTLVDRKIFTLIGFHIPCGQKYDKNSFVNIDGTPLPEGALELSNNMQGDEYLGTLYYDKTDDYSLTQQTKSVLCAITLPNSPHPGYSLLAAQTASNGCPDDTYTYKETNSGPNKVRRCYKLYEAADITDQCKVIDYCRPLHPKAIPATINSIEERDFLKTLVDRKIFTLIGFHIPCGQNYDKNSFVNIDGTPLPEGALELSNNMQGDEYLGTLYYDKTDDYSLTQQTKSVLCAITLPNSPHPGYSLLAAQTASNGCPDDTYTYKETNSGPNKVRRCYKLYEAADITDQCKVIDYCRPLHPKAIPATINSIEERDFLKTLVDRKIFTLIGFHIPCGQNYDKNSFVNIDGTPLPEGALELSNNMQGDEYLGTLYYDKTDDYSLTQQTKSVLCAITLPNSPHPGYSLLAAQTASNGCPDDTYTYKETNSGPNKVRRCYKLYEAADITDQCKVIDYCRPLHPKAIPATINSIEERDFLKTLVDRKIFTLIGFHIPCGQNYDKNSFVNIDGTPLPEGALELSNNMQGDEYLGTLYYDKTDDYSLTQQTKSVLCAITLPNSPHPGYSLLAAQTASNGCPDDTYTYKETNSGPNKVRRCYKLYEAADITDHCKVIDYCRPLHPKAIPATINSIEERDFLKTLVNTSVPTLIGFRIPCGQKYDKNSFVNIDGTPLPEGALELLNNMLGDEYLGMLASDATDDYSFSHQSRHVLCAITLPNPHHPGYSLLAAQTASNGCPDDTYTYKETNSGPNRVRRCYKLYEAADITDQCKVIDYCRPLHPKAIPATINSIEERDFLKTLVNTSVPTLIGFHIPCGQPYNKNSFVNIDGTLLPEGTPEKLNNAAEDEYLGMLKTNLTDDLSLKQQTKSVICAITLPNNPCPDDSYSYKEINGIGFCFHFSINQPLRATAIVDVQFNVY